MSNIENVNSVSSDVSLQRKNESHKSEVLPASANLQEQPSTNPNAVEQKGVDPRYLRRLYNRSDMSLQKKELLLIPRYRPKKNLSGTAKDTEYNAESSSTTVDTELSESSSSSETEDLLDNDTKSLKKTESSVPSNSEAASEPLSPEHTPIIRKNQMLSLECFTTKVYMLVNGVPVFARRPLCAVVSKVPLGIFAFHTLYCKAMVGIDHTLVAGDINEEERFIFAGINGDDFIDDIQEGIFSSSVNIQREATLSQLEGTFAKNDSIEAYLNGETKSLGLYATLLVPELLAKQQCLVCNPLKRCGCTCHRREYDLIMDDMRSMEMYKEFHIGKSYYVYGFARFRIGSQKKSDPTTCDSLCLLVNVDGHFFAIQNTFVASRKFFYDVPESILNRYNSDEFVFDYRRQPQKSVKLFLKNGIDISIIDTECVPVKPPVLSQEFIAWLGNFSENDDPALDKMCARSSFKPQFTSPLHFLHLDGFVSLLSPKSNPIPGLNVTPPASEFIADAPESKTVKCPSLVSLHREFATKRKFHGKRKQRTRRNNVSKHDSAEQISDEAASDVDDVITHEDGEEEEMQYKEPKRAKRGRKPKLQKSTSIRKAESTHGEQPIDSSPEKDRELERGVVDKQHHKQNLQSKAQTNSQAESELYYTGPEQEQQQLLQIQQLELLMKQQEQQQEQHKLLLKLQSSVPQSSQASYARQMILLSRQRTQIQSQRHQLQLMEKFASFSQLHKPSLTRVLKNEQDQLQLQDQLQKIQLRLSQNLIENTQTY